MNAAPGKRKRSALVWVLVACAALGCAGLGAAILFVIATPAIARSIENAKEAACAAEMRGVYHELIGYVTSHSTDKGAVETWWGDAQETVAPAASYAWRDIERFPLERFPGTEREPLAACGGELHHAPDVAHVLYTDGSIDTLSLAGLKASGVVPADTDVLRFGPGSPVPELRKLGRD